MIIINNIKKKVIKLYNTYIHTPTNLIILLCGIIIFIVGVILLILYLTGDLLPESSKSGKGPTPGPGPGPTPTIPPTPPYCKNSKYLKCPNPSQEWINNNIMKPDFSVTDDKPAYFKFNTDKQQLCKYNPKNQELLCQNEICPFGMYFDGATQTCKNNLCEDNNNNCIRGITINEQPIISKPDNLQLILTDYSLSNDAQVSSDPNVYQLWLNDIITNFCKPKKIDIFCLYITQNYTWMINDLKNKDSINGIDWLYNNFITLCVQNNIIPGVTVYANFNDSNWETPSDNTWPTIGSYIGKINKYVYNQNGSPSNYIVNGKSIMYLVFDKEACNCGDLDSVRTEFKKGYTSITNQPLPDDFKILASGGPGINFNNNNKNDIGLGEIYWNVGQSWPCEGNPSQYINYAPVCKKLSSHVAFKNNPNTYIDYLIQSSNKSNGRDYLNQIYEKQSSLTVPLFSFESLYSQINGPNNQYCSTLGYWNNSTTQNKPTTGDKACGTFDGFSYWDWDKFEQFMYLYVNKFRNGNTELIPYVGLYAAAFIPKFWMNTNTFKNQNYYAKLPSQWPLNCNLEKNKCKDECTDIANISCNNDQDCKEYCPEFTASFCGDNKMCRIKKT